MRPENTNFKIICAGNIAEIYLYDVIGEDYFGGISAKRFADEMVKARGAKQIDLRINSPGGDVFEGNTMFTLLKSHSATINVFVDGVAASIASVIAMAGDVIEISSTGMMMIHEPAGFSFGPADEHTKMASLLEKIRDTIAETYVSRGGGDTKEFLKLMAAEKWFNAQEAVDMKLADRIGADMKMAACIRPKLFNYKHVPEELIQRAPTPDPEPEVLTFENEARRKIRALK